MEKVYEVQCPHCNYKWVPRVENPKYCPYCKRPLAKISTAKSKQVIGLKEVKQMRPGLVWCVNHDNTVLAMYEIDGQPLCLECTIEALRAKGQLKEEDIFRRLREQEESYNQW